MIAYSCVNFFDIYFPQFLNKMDISRCIVLPQLQGMEEHQLIRQQESGIIVRRKVESWQCLRRILSRSCLAKGRKGPIHVDVDISGWSGTPITTWAQQLHARCCTSGMQETHWWRRCQNLSCVGLWTHLHFIQFALLPLSNIQVIDNRLDHLRLF